MSSLVCKASRTAPDAIAAYENGFGIVRRSGLTRVPGFTNRSPYVGLVPLREPTTEYQEGAALRYLRLRALARQAAIVRQKEREYVTRRAEERRRRRSPQR